MNLFRVFAYTVFVLTLTTTTGCIDSDKASKIIDVIVDDASEPDIDSTDTSLDTLTVPDATANTDSDISNSDTNDQSTTNIDSSVSETPNHEVTTVDSSVGTDSETTAPVNITPGTFNAGLYYTNLTNHNTPPPSSGISADNAVSGTVNRDTLNESSSPSNAGSADASPTVPTNASESEETVVAAITPNTPNTDSTAGNITTTDIPAPDSPDVTDANTAVADTANPNTPNDDMADSNITDSDAISPDPIDSDTTVANPDTSYPAPSDSVTPNPDTTEVTDSDITNPNSSDSETVVPNTSNPEESKGPQPANQPVYFVDKNSATANDSNSGLSEELPWKTLDKAFSAVKAGDFVYVKGSKDPNSSDAIYDRSFRNGLDIKTPGTKDKIIVFRNFPGHTVILQGNGGKFGIALDNASFHHIYGFIIRNFNKAAEGFNAKSNITIEKSEFTSTFETGLRLRNVTDFVMRDVYVHHCFEAGISVRNGTNVIFDRVESSYNSDRKGTDGDGDGFHTYGGDNLLFLNAIARGNSEDGFDLNANAVLMNAIATDNPAANIKLWRRIEDNFAPKISYIINSLIANAGEAGIKISEGAELHLYNSVIYNSGDEGIAFRTPSSSTQSAVTSEIVNSIIAENGYQGIDLRKGNLLTEHHNLYYRNTYLHGSGFTIAPTSLKDIDPDFIDTANGDFHISSNSLAVNAGTSLISSYLEFDFEGESRADNAVDIGLDEIEETADLADLDIDIPGASESEGLAAESDAGPLGTTTGETETSIDTEAGTETNTLVDSIADTITLDSDVAAPEFDNNAMLTWSMPTLREDNSEIEPRELSGYTLYISNLSGYEEAVIIDNPHILEHLFQNLEPDTYQFTIEAIDSEGLRSKPSEMVSKVIKNPYESQQT